MNDLTIYALASGHGRAGIAVIRISGPNAVGAAKALSDKELPVRRAVRIDLKNPADEELLDQGLAIFFPGPASFTGEDVVELHVHGGIAVIDSVLSTLATIDGLRLAEPGEFTRRGFENGKIDLTAAEGVADLVAAETTAQRRQALRQMGGALATFCDASRSRLIAALAHWETAIDFSEEELPQDLEGSVVDIVSELVRDFESTLADNGRGERLRHGVDVAIVGPPNAGKSTLLNRLAKRDAAIVSSTAGTTRDVIEVHFELGGYPVILADTAGFRESGDDIEKEGVRRAIDRAAQADLRIIVLDGEIWPEIDVETESWTPKPGVIAINKIDLIASDVPNTLDQQPILAISAKDGTGVDALLETLESLVACRFGGASAPVVTRARHREALETALTALQRFLAATDRLSQPELASEDLRLAARAIGRVTGSVDVEDLLDVIFADFCIGK
jgi:tRNA modification GTPase